jgi:homoserine dehydrogenase
MVEEGISYEQALGEAQEKGYAEADPELDVGGGDSAHKLCVLARLAFGVDVRLEEVLCEGITSITLQDLEYARDLGYTVKLLAIGSQSEDGIGLRVHPTLLRHSHPMAAVTGVLNAVCVSGDRVGEVILTGQGAGRWATASAVVADICQVALGTYGEQFAQMSQFGDVPPADMKDFKSISTRYYLRLSCQDRPGVLAQVAGVLGDEQISIASCRQVALPEGDQQHVPVVFMTHKAQEGAMQRAIGRINNLEAIEARQTRMIRVEDI